MRLQHIQQNSVTQLEVAPCWAFGLGLGSRSACVVNGRLRQTGVGTGVAPFVTTCFGPRTVAAGFTGRTWLTTSQSPSMRMAARCCLTVGGRPGVGPDVGRHVQRRDRREPQAPRLTPRQKLPHGSPVRRPRPPVGDPRGEKLEKLLHRRGPRVDDQTDSGTACWATRSHSLPRGRARRRVNRPVPSSRAESRGAGRTAPCGVPTSHRVSRDVTSCTRGSRWFAGAGCSERYVIRCRSPCACGPIRDACRPPACPRRRARCTAAD